MSTVSLFNHFTINQTNQPTNSPFLFPQIPSPLPTQIPSQLSTECPDPNMDRTVLTIECLKGSSKADEWNHNMLQTGDIVEELTVGNNYLSLKAPFPNGRTGVQKALHDCFKKKHTSIKVRVRRGDTDFVELAACIVPNGWGGGGKYALRSIDDANYAVGFVDRTARQCFALQGSRSSRVVCALSEAKLHSGYVSYPWEKKMHEFLPVPKSSCFPSLLLLPKASDHVASRYNDLEDTLARANAWLHASQASGVPILFMNVQTESLLTKISGERASSTVNSGSMSDLSNLANASLYGFEDYHGVDIGVVRAVRLWYGPVGDEIAVEINLREGDTKLGFSISRTEEGFIYISSVSDDDENGVSAMRSGLLDLYREAAKASKLLVVSRVSNEKVLPWMVSSTGAVRCFDTVSLSHKLCLHRHALQPILLHIFMWDRELLSQNTGTAMFSSLTPSTTPIPSDVQLPQVPIDNRGAGAAAPGSTLERDTAGETSFRFHNFSLSNNWV